MKFQTKKELLRYLWKNEDDRKLVDRMVARGEVRLEWRIYVLEENGAEVSSSDLDYLNKEYERLEGLLDYSLRQCYNIMKKKGVIGSEDTYEDFYNKITFWYEKGTDRFSRALEEEKEVNAWLWDLMKKYNIGKASDFIS